MKRLIFAVIAITSAFSFNASAKAIEDMVGVTATATDEFYVVTEGQYAPMKRRDGVLVINVVNIVTKTGNGYIKGSSAMNALLIKCDEQTYKRVLMWENETGRGSGIWTSSNVVKALTKNKPYDRVDPDSVGADLVDYACENFRK